MAEEQKYKILIDILIYLIYTERQVYSQRPHNVDHNESLDLDLLTLAFGTQSLLQ